MALARSLYRLSEDLPRTENFGLQLQMRRAAVSIPSNIAEGHGRLSDAQFRNFLGIARGSFCELLTQVELARDLGLIRLQSANDFIEQADEVAKLLNALIAVLGETK